MTTYTARATREGGWWGVQLVEQPEIFTQTRRLDQIPFMVRDALSMCSEIEPDPKKREYRCRSRGRYPFPGLLKL